MSSNNNGVELHPEPTVNPDDNEIILDESMLPFVITYRRVYERPKVEEWFEFRGWRKGFKRLADKAKATIHDCFYEQKREVVSPGRTQAVHWGVNVADPFDVSGEQELVARCYGHDKPPAAVNFHVVQMVEGENTARWQDTRAVEHPAYGPRPVRPLDPANDKRRMSEETAAARIRDSLDEAREDVA